MNVNPATNRITTCGYGYDDNGNLTAMPLMTMSYKNVYFGRRQVYRSYIASSGTVFDDRIGPAVRPYFPYGEEPTTTEQNRVKFATYYRDNTTALDYAQNRYYSSSIARFTTPEPYAGSARSGNPQAWNRYSYAGNDPANLNEPSGLDYITPIVDWRRCPLGALRQCGWCKRCAAEGRASPQPRTDATPPRSRPSQQWTVRNLLPLAGPVAVSVQVPGAPGLTIEIPFPYNLQTNAVTLGLGLAHDTPGFNLGIVPIGTVSDPTSVLQGCSWSAQGQAFPVGVQVTGGVGSGLVWGPTIGSPGGGVGYTCSTSPAMRK